MNQQQQQEGFFRQMQGLLYLLWYCVLAAGTVLHMFSVRPGTKGPGAIIRFLPLSWLLMFIGPVLLGGTDESATAIMWIGQFSFWLAGIHIIAYVRAHKRGQGTHSHHIGISWLSPKGSPDEDPTTSCIAHSIVAVGFAVFCFALDAPYCGVYWLINIPLSFFAYSTISMRDAYRGMKVHDASVDNTYWQGHYQRHFDNLDDME